MDWFLKLMCQRVQRLLVRSGHHNTVYGKDSQVANMAPPALLIWPLTLAAGLPESQS